MKSYNAIDMKGRLYNYALQTVSTDKGEAIGGEVVFEVDAEGTTASVRYFAYPVFNNGKTNKTYGILEDMMAGNYKTVVDDGEDAAWLAASGSVDVSYFVSKNSSDNELARAQKLRGSFINPNTDKKYSNKWKVDFLITKVEDIEADEEKQLPRYLKVNGFLVDDYNKRVMGAQFQARTQGAIDYILGLEVTVDQPYFVSTWGKLSKVSRLVVRKNAFGEDEQDEYNSTQWVIVGMNPDAYDFGDDSAMTFDEYAELREGLEKHMTEQAEKDSGSGGGKADLAF